MTNRPEKLALLHGLLSEQGLARASNTAEFLQVFDGIAENGTVCLLKIDGARPKNERYTLIISNGILGDEFIRYEGGDLELGLLDVLLEYLGKLNSRS